MTEEEFTEAISQSSLSYRTSLMIHMLHDDEVYNLNPTIKSMFVQILVNVALGLPEHSTKIPNCWDQIGDEDCILKLDEIQ